MRLINDRPADSMQRRRIAGSANSLTGEANTLPRRHVKSSSVFVFCLASYREPIDNRALLKTRRSSDRVDALIVATLGEEFL